MTRSYPTSKRPAGVTLVEMLFVISITGVIALMSMKRVSTYIEERNVASAARVLHNDLQQAFAIAARNRQPVRIAFASTDTALQVTNRASTTRFMSRRLGRGSGFMLTPSDVAFCTSSCTNASVDVFPNGWASDTLSLTITRGSYTRGIRMSRSGLVTSR